MYLKTVALKNFRSFDAGEVELQKDLTVFVGENNGGKSNAIDAIRLLTQPLGGRREIYCEPTDVRFQSQTTGFELEGVFSDLSVGQQGRLISASTDSTMSEARFGLRYSGGLGDRPSLWAGKPGNLPEPGCHDMVRHVYLPPLRDAKRALASGNPTPFLLAMVQQESNSQHYRVPEPQNEDDFVVVGLDRGDANNPHRITSRGYGLGQFTIAHHPPRAADISDFIVNIQGNVSKAYSELRGKLDGWVVGPNDTADDRMAEHPLLPLRVCRFAMGDPRRLSDCANCARNAPKVDIVSNSVNGTPFYAGAPQASIYRPTQYYSDTKYTDIPDRSAFGCDWPYAARRYNGGGVNSFHYQARILRNLTELP